MVTRVLSALFAGRETELAGLNRSFDSVISGRAQRLVLVSAEAGGGKSRLIGEFTRRIEERARVVMGNCIEIGEAGLPFTPFTTGLRQLIRERGVAEMSALIGEPHARQLAWLQPEFGEPPSPEPDLLRVRLFESFRKLLENLSTQKPLVWVVEDLHWADQGTRDLLTFLASSLQKAPLLLVASYRTEALTLVQGLRSMVAELARQYTTDSFVLPRLSRRDVAIQLEGILGYVPPSDLLNEVYRRGCGVPLFTEAMVDGDGNLRRALPGTFTDLLSGIMHEMPEVTQQVLRAMSIGGLSVGHDLLAAVTGLDDNELLNALRPAIHGNILIPDGAGYAFRHALLRHSVREATLSIEAKRLHLAYANALQSDASLSPDLWISMALAQHWRAAGDAERAIQSAWKAAQEAASRFAYAEQLQMLEQILELWSIPASSSLMPGVSRLRILELATDAACWAAESARGLTHVEHALALLDSDKDGEKVAALLLQRAMLKQQLMQPGEIEDLTRAVRLAPESTRLRAEALGQLCRAQILRGEPACAKPFAEELSALANALDDCEYKIEASIACNQLATLDGEDRTATLREALAAAKDAGLGRLEVIAYVALMQGIERLGRHADAIEIGRVALVRTLELGQARYMGPTLSQHLATSLTSVGRWDEAIEVVLEGLDLDPSPLGRMQLLLCAGHISIARGDVKESTRVIRELHALARRTTAVNEQARSLLRLEIELNLMKGDMSAARACSETVPAEYRGADTASLWPLLTTAVKTCSAARDLDGLLGNLEKMASRLPRERPVESAHALTFEAERLHVAKENSAPAWKKAAHAWSRLGQPYPEAYANLKLAAAIAAAGDRSGAIGPLRGAAQVANQLRAEPLQGQVGSLAQRARIDLDLDPVPVSKSCLGLTGRELQVLKLVAMGRSNREIAETLFVSVKTASVHVSNILAKLDVRTRGAAAAVAHRLHLFDIN